MCIASHSGCAAAAGKRGQMAGADVIVPRGAPMICARDRMCVCARGSTYVHACMCCSCSTGQARLAASWCLCAARRIATYVDQPLAGRWSLDRMMQAARARRPVHLRSHEARDEPQHLVVGIKESCSMRGAWHHASAVPVLVAMALLLVCSPGPCVGLGSCSAPASFEPMPNYASIVPISKSTASVFDFVLTADCNLDGYLDMIGTDAFTDVDAPRAVLFLANGSSGFHDPITIVRAIPLGPTGIGCLCSLDGPGDLFPELVLSAGNSLVYAVNQPGSPDVFEHVLRPIVIRDAEPFAFWIKAHCAKIDDDDLNDIVHANAIDSTLYWYRNLGAGGGFASHAIQLISRVDWGSSRQWALAVDGVVSPVDLVFATGGSLFIYSADAATSPVGWSMSELDQVMPSTILVADMDGNRRADIVVGVGAPAEISESQLYCYFQSTSGSTFSQALVIGDPGAPTVDIGSY